MQQFRVSHGIIETATNGQLQLIDQLTQLEAREQAYRKVYETLLKHITENQQQASFPVPDARVIAAAIQPVVEPHPKTQLGYDPVELCRLILGTAFATMLSMLDDSVQTAGQVRQSLGLRILGSLLAHRLGYAKGTSPIDRVEVIDAPHSGFREAMRNTKSRCSTRAGKAGICLGVLSLMPGEGASTVALNLATLFAGPR